MKIKLLSTALLLAGFALPAGDPPGFYAWTSAELKMQRKNLAPKINEQKLATQQMGGFGNYSFLTAHRQASGEAEYHERQADISIVQSGEGTLVYGGKIVDGKTTAPGEIRGPSISGGLERKLGPGDMFTIPAKMPHQMKVAAGKEITYLVIKVTQ
jgi:mannose-6-phosphate isomerase-like protein (cupin superfamily)